MGKKIYFTRHGQTIWNVSGQVCGATDIELTDLGRSQAAELGKIIKEEYKDIDEILYSPLIRAKDTALIVSKVSGIPAFEEPLLKEQNFGIWEGKGRRSEEFRAARLNFIDSYQGGESMLRIAQRIYNLLDRIKNEDSDKVYLLVAHNGIARQVNSYFNDLDNTEYSDFGIRNCQVLEFEFD